MREPIVFEKGCLCENYPWKITFDEINSGCDNTVCKHCVEIPLDDPRCQTQHGKNWLCPRVVVAKNEGGFNCTSVCLDCILEAAKELQ